MTAIIHSESFSRERTDEQPAPPAPATSDPRSSPGSTGPTDAELVANLREGDLGALHLLQGRHNSAVYRRAYAILWSGPDAEDVAQVAWCKALGLPADGEGKPFDLSKAFPTYNLSRQFGPWIRTVAEHAALDRVRSRWWTRVVLKDPKDLVDAPSTSTGPATEPGGLPPLEVRPKLTDELAACARELPESFQAVYRLAVEQERAHKEIGAVLAISAVLSRQRLRRARELLRACLAKKGLLDG